MEEARVRNLRRANAGKDLGKAASVISPTIVGILSPGMQELIEIDLV